MCVVDLDTGQPVPQLHRNGHDDGRGQCHCKAKGTGAHDLLAADRTGQQSGGSQGATPNVDGTDLHALDTEAAALLALERCGSDHETGVDDGEKEGDDPMARNAQCDGGHDDLGGDDEVA